MTLSRHNACRLAALAATLLAARTAEAATVPTGESFESYTNGHPIVLETDWSGATNNPGIVTNDAAAIAALTAYTNAGNTFPLPGATHKKVLRISEALTNNISSAAGGVVITDLLFMPAQRDAAPAGSTNYQFACYVNTNNLLVVWHDAGASNAWITLTNSPSLQTGVWTRISVYNAYANHRYKVVINGTTPIEDDRGWSTAAQGTHPGAWFDMVQTNGYMSRFRTEGNATGYLDDMVFTNRSLSYSGTTFSEAAANDGSIVSSLTLTLALGVFTGTNGTDFVAGGEVAVTNVPNGLTAVVTRTGDTTLSASLTGNATAHANADHVSDLTFTFQDSAFSVGHAASVTGYQKTDVQVDYADPPTLTYVPTTFAEAAANDGSIGNTIVITLTDDVFTNISPLVPGVHYSTSGVPAGLTFSLVRNSPTQLRASAGNQATSHGDAGDTSMTLTFLDAAFDTVGAAHVPGSTTNLAFDFADTPSLNYSTTTYTEKTANDGSVDGGTINVVAETFTGPIGTNYVLGGDVLVTNLPGGLGVSIVKSAAQQLTVSFTGAASSHADAHDSSSLEFAFQDTAFSGNNASAVDGATRSDLGINFNDPPLLTYSPLSFGEATANNGSIANTIEVTLADDTFVGVSPLAAGTHYSTSGVPAGLAITLARSSATQVTVSVSGNAAAHADTDDTSMTLTFESAAFVNVAAANITDSSKGLAFDFENPPLLDYSRTTFTELSDGAIDNTTPLSIILSGTDSFASGPFAAGAHFSVEGLPTGLSASIERVDGTNLLLRLNGTATSHDVSDSTTFTNRFLTAAFEATQGDQVTGHEQTFTITFNNSAVTINPLPYRQSFETYADGLHLDGTGGWRTAAVLGDGATVTTETAIVTALTGSFSQFPLDTNHTQVLRVTHETTDEVKSGAGDTIYSDLMFYITAREAEPPGSTNYQFAFYVNTNQQPVVWHHDTSGSPTNTWTTLTGAPTVSTGAWHRVTVVQDYVSQKFRVHLDGSSAPLSNPTEAGNWFNMVGTGNSHMSRLRVQGGTPEIATYLDDIYVSTEIPGFFFLRASLFKFR